MSFSRRTSLILWHRSLKTLKFREVWNDPVSSLTSLSLSRSVTAVVVTFPCNPNIKNNQWYNNVVLFVSQRLWCTMIVKPDAPSLLLTLQVLELTSRPYNVAMLSMIQQLLMARSLHIHRSWRTDRKEGKELRTLYHPSFDSSRRLFVSFSSSLLVYLRLHFADSLSYRSFQG